MRAGEPSSTAQRVAAHRLKFERLHVPYGDPLADERLARDVAAGVAVASETPMVRYLAARTRFFDRVTVDAIEGGVDQIVVTAAGYDGRALRYAKAGVAWFEVDHPDTQRDKRARLTRLGIDVAHVCFVAADFAVDDVAAGLHAAGHDPQRTTLFLCEGVAVYLDEAVLTQLLRGLRAAASETSRVAISLSVGGDDDPGRAARRRAFQTAAAAMGEPARTVLTADGADAVFAAAGWRPTSPAGPDDRARRAGLVVAEPA